VKALVKHTVQIRDAAPSDMTGCHAIERVSFPDPWSVAMLRAHLRGDVNQFLVATIHQNDTDTIAGYAIAHVIADESELLNIAVHPDWRGRSIGAALLDALLDRCRSRGAASMMLDVRESNTPARTLYERRGFVTVGRRRRYYQHPDEDGLLMRAAFA
jgi:ribosomal-protein-alanine N-acetyltransferase